MKNRLKWISIFILGVLLLMGYQNCSPKHRRGKTVTLSSEDEKRIIQGKAMGIVQAHCSSCHSPGSSVTTPIADILDFNQLVTDGYIEFGKPQTSLLYIDLVDGVMPPTGSPPLSPVDLETLRVWLLADNATSDDLSAILRPPDTGGGGTPATFTEVFTIITGTCANCHLNGNASGGVTLNNFNEIRNYVVPNNTAASVLYGEVQRNEMPPANPLSIAAKQAIFSWINDGAQNN